MIERDLELTGADLLGSESMQRLTALEPWQSERYSRTDQGNALLFADFFGDRARFMKEQGVWYVFDGCRWRMDQGGLAAMSLCKALATLLINYSAGIPDVSRQELFVQQALKWHSRRFRLEVLRDAADVYPLEMTQMDANPMYLNCPNGTLDLETGALHPHDPADLITRVCGADYLPGVRSERWERFVLEVMALPGTQMSFEEDEEIRRRAAWLKRALGYALTGDTRLECMFMLYGPGTRNGKGTMMESMLRLMGDYGAVMRPESLSLCGPGQTGSGPTEDIARLRGARLVSVSEPSRGQYFSEGLIKTLTGNDTLTARFLHQNSFQFRPQFKIFVNTNHTPTMHDLTVFDSGRIQLINFERHFAPDEQDRSLKAFLANPLNLSGILNWCLDGLRAVREDGFRLGDPPESMRRALNAYRAENDLVGQFVRECLQPSPGAVTKSADIYRAYAAWCHMNGHKQESAIALRKGLAAHFRLGKGRLGGGNITNVVHDCEVWNQDDAG